MLATSLLPLPFIWEILGKVLKRRGRETKSKLRMSGAALRSRRVWQLHAHSCDHVCLPDKPAWKRHLPLPRSKGGRGPIFWKVTALALPLTVGYSHCYSQCLISQPTYKPTVDILIQPVNNLTAWPVHMTTVHIMSHRILLLKTDLAQSSKTWVQG